MGKSKLFVFQKLHFTIYRSQFYNYDVFRVCCVEHWQIKAFTIIYYERTAYSIFETKNEVIFGIHRSCYIFFGVLQNELTTSWQRKININSIKAIEFKLEIERNLCNCFLFRLKINLNQRLKETKRKLLLGFSLRTRYRSAITKIENGR